MSVVNLSNTTNTIYLAVLLAFALVIHTVEASIPVPMPVPGAKLGLANIITLTVLLVCGFKNGLLIAVLRSVLGSFFIGNFLSFGFMLSISAAVVSVVVMTLILPLYHRGYFSLTSVSIFGAAFHNTTQLVIASIIIQNFVLIRGYLPLLLLLSIPTGFFIGLVATSLVPVMKRLNFS